MKVVSESSSSLVVTSLYVCDKDRDSDTPTGDTWRREEEDEGERKRMKEKERGWRRKKEDEGELETFFGFSCFLLPSILVRLSCFKKSTIQELVLSLRVCRDCPCLQHCTIPCRSELHHVPTRFILYSLLVRKFHPSFLLLVRKFHCFFLYLTFTSQLSSSSCSWNTLILSHTQSSLPTVFFLVIWSLSQLVSVSWSNFFWSEKNESSYVVTG